MKKFDMLIVGAGVFGATTALELVRRGYHVGLINPDTIPHHLAASTDISKAVRMEYGSDPAYFELAEKSIQGWKEWNIAFGQDIYHEVGFLMLCQDLLSHPRQEFEKTSYAQLLNHGYHPACLTKDEIAEAFPAFADNRYQNAIFNKVGGFVESSKAIESIVQQAVKEGLKLYTEQTADQLIRENQSIVGVRTKEGDVFYADHLIVAAGAASPFLLPSLAPYVKITGHPVFWLMPQDKSLFTSDNLPVFTADISNTGWYGFPYSSKNGVVKIAKHTNGLELDPLWDDRKVSDAEVEDMRAFVQSSMPALAKAPLVYTRRCLYTDTLDGHFWIDKHPELNGLSVCTGGSGHAMKMAPVLGQICADMVERKENPYLERFRWRHLTQETVQMEEARFVEDRRI